MVTTRSQNRMKPDVCKIVILDLDGTLHDIEKYRNNELILEKHIVDILKYFKALNKKIVLASLNTYADTILKMYNVDHFFDSIYNKNWMLYGTDKSDFFTKIHELYKIPYENMILFDDNEDHCKEAEEKRIKYVHVDKQELLQWKDVDRGLQMFKID